MFCVYSKRKLWFTSREHTNFFSEFLKKIKDALLVLRQHLATESPLTMIKSAFYSTSKTLFVLKIFKFLSCLFGHAVKRLDG